MSYDYTDSQIRELVSLTHYPNEAAADGQSILGEGVIPIPTVVLCRTDRERWPCSAIAGLRAYEASVKAQTRTPPVVEDSAAAADTTVKVAGRGTVL